MSMRDLQKDIYESLFESIGQRKGSPQRQRNVHLDIYRCIRQQSCSKYIFETAAKVLRAFWQQHGVIGCYSLRDPAGQRSGKHADHSHPPAWTLR